MFTFYLNKYWLIFARPLVLDCFLLFYYSFVFYIFIVTVEINSKYSKIQQVTDDKSELMPNQLLQLECEKSSQKMQLPVSAIISQLFQVIIPAKCVSSILELNWNQRFPDKKTTNLWSSVRAAHTTTKQVIPRRRRKGREQLWNNLQLQKCKTVFHR